MSPESTSAVVDTVALHYFLLAERCGLLAQLVGSPFLVPSVVFDPSEGEIPADARSELTRGIWVLGRKAKDARQPVETRNTSALKTSRLNAVFEAWSEGLITVAEMTSTERALAGRLSSVSHVAEFGMSFPLGDGEAACIAVACERGCTLVTDDSAALSVYAQLRPTGPYERIRALLQRGARVGVISEAEANAIHAEMTSLGFWDREPPFPQSK